MKYFRKVLFYMVFSLLIIFTTAVVLVVVYQDQIKGKIIRNLNGHINTPIDVKKIEVSIFENLPYISIVLNETVVSESREINPGTLLKAKKIALTINPVKIFYGDYSIDGIVIEDGSIMLKMDKNGLSNFQVFKNPVKSEKSNSSLQLKNIRLKNIKATVSDALRAYNLELLASNLQIDLEYSESQLNLLVKGGVQTHFIEVSDNAFLKDKQLEVALGIRYDFLHAIVSVDPGNISIHGSEYRVKGKYHISEIGEINCFIEGVGTDIQSLVSLLPENITKEFIKYQSEGDIYFDLNIEGRLNKSEAPGVAAHFGFKNAGIKHSESDLKIENASFEGWFATNSLKDMRNAELRIRDFTSTLEGRKIEGSFTLNNFVDKHVEFSLRGAADVSSLFNFYKQNYFSDYSGSIEVDIEFKGRLEDLKSVKTVKNISSNGQITLDNVYFNIRDTKLPFMALNGALLFNDSNVALNDLEGKLGNSHFILNGLLVNIFSYLLMEDERLAITAKLESEYIDLNELLEKENDSTDGKPYSLHISKML
ncbi:MAG: AsmA family protein, partial [Cyclobacteriaceae bacterium]|nr:AsmA family protein [Cyclobacteriaceae bacterium]